MASYGLKYYAEWRNYRKHDYRLEVLRRGYSGSAKAMGDFSGCILEVQGSQGDIIAPIVKTQLRFTLIDTYDEPDTGSVKHGDWQEFYTPDAGLYKVVLKAWDSGAWVTEWSGYITPDSWAENLDYRTGVTITARDNIGHLQDFAFDMSPNSDGLVKISDLIDRAMEICELAMDYTIARSGLGPSSLNSIEADGVYLHDAYINASIFEGGNWYDALEKTLEAIGMALRYVGNNSVEITYLRNLPYMGNPYAQAGYQELEFYGGTLELDPAVKEIEEVVEYDHEPTISMDLSSGVTLGAEQTYLCKITGRGRGFTFNGGEHDAPYNVLSSRGESNISNLTDGLLDVSGRSPVEDLIKNEGESWSEYTFVPANVLGDNGPMLVLFANVIGTKAVINLRFNRSALTLRWVTGTEYKLADIGFSLEKIQYSVSYGSGSSICYWDGKGWASQTEPFKIDQEYDWKNEFGEELEIKLTPCDALTGGFPLRIIIWHIDYKVTQRPPEVPLVGVYARLQSATISVDSIALKGDRVLTVNNSSFNLRMDRKPIIGALSRTMEFVVPANYWRAIYYYKDGALTMYPYLVRFNGQASGREVPLPVLIHEQILCYYHGAARVLHGDCAPINKVRLEFQNRFRYKNTYYLLQGGSLDMFSGIVTGGVFREYAMFDDLWSQSPSWSNKPILDGDSYTPSGGGGGGGGITTETDPVFSASPAAGITKADIDKWNSSAGGGTVTSIGLSMPTGFSVQGSPVTGQGTFTVAYDNGYSLPTTAKQGQWDNKQDAISDLQQIRTGAGKGKTAYQKPRTGIPSTDIAPGVIPDVSQFITRLVNDLVYYYTKSETYTKAEVAALIGAIQTFHYEIVASTSAVTSPSNNVLYLIGPTGSGADKYEEYVYDPTKAANERWVKIGDTSIDLSGLLPLTGGTLTGDLRLKPANDNYGLRIRFGDGDYAYIHEDSDDHLLLYARNGFTFSAGSGNGIHTDDFIEIGDARLVWDSTTHSLHVTKRTGSSYAGNINVYADGDVGAGGVGSGATVNYVNCANQTAYNNIATKDPATIYTVGTAPSFSKIYLGTILIYGS